MIVYTVVVQGGRQIRTLDNPLNVWVRCLDDNQMYKRESPQVPLLNHLRRLRSAGQGPAA